MSGIEIAKLTCIVLVNSVSIYKAIKGAIAEYKDGPKDAEELGEEIHCGIVRIQNIATVLFKRGVIDVLDGANAECVFNILKRLETILKKYGEWVADTNIGTDYPRLDADDSKTVQSIAVAMAESSSNTEMFEAIVEAVESELTEIIVFEKQFGRWKRLKWMVKDHSKLKHFKDDIQRWVKNLVSALPAIVLLTAGMDSDKLWKLSQEDLQYLPGLAPAARRKALKITRQTITVPELDVTQIRPLQSPPGQFAGKQMLYKGTFAFVEFKSYPNSQATDVAMENIKELAGLLSDGGASGDLSVFKCLGYLHEPTQLRAHLLFRIPSLNGRQGRLRSLTSLMNNVALDPFLGVESDVYISEGTITIFLVLLFKMFRKCPPSTLPELRHRMYRR
jgi:hypothetical protein